METGEYRTVFYEFYYCMRVSSFSMPVAEYNSGICAYQAEMEIVQYCHDGLFSWDDDTDTFYFDSAFFNVFKGGYH